MTSQTLITRLGADLLTARKARDQLTVTTLQAVIAAIDNAGAVSAPVNAGSIGVGSTEVTRRELAEQDLQEIVKREITELQRTIVELDNRENSYADELRHRIAILEKYHPYH